MKKTLIFTNLVTLSLLVIVYQSSCTKRADTPVPVSSNCYENDYQNLRSNPMAFEYLASLVTSYRDQQWGVINNSGASGGGQDARAVWFSLPSLKKFISDIETQTKNNCGNCDKKLGIRIYYGAYPEAGKMETIKGMETVPAQYSMLHTVVMVPTYQDSRFVGSPGENVDFDPSHMTGCTPASFDSLSKSSSTIMALSPDLTVMNHGSLIPPPSNVTCTGAKVMHFLDGLNCQ